MSESLDLSIVVPFKDRAELTGRCLDSLHRFGEPVREILLVSNNSSPSEVRRITDIASGYPNARVLEYDRPFNFQAINNHAAGQAAGAVLMMLNNDVELVQASQGLLGAMYGLARQEQVGAVGCVLLYEDGKTIQHAGVYLVPGKTADHLYGGQKLKRVRARITSGAYGYDPFRNLQVTAVTAAAMMIEKTKFIEVGGMNEDFIVCGGDVDICLRLADRGYESWVVGADQGHMLHKESVSRSTMSIPYNDFVESYRIYVEHFDLEKGDRHLGWEEVRHAR